MQFFTAESESDVARAMLEMVRRRAPVLMRQGGGALPQEMRCGQAMRLTDHQRSEVLRLRRAGVGVMKIGPMVGCSQTTVSKICKDHGIPSDVKRRVEVLA